LGKPGFVVTPDGSFGLQEFMERLLGRPVESLLDRGLTVREEDLDVDIMNVGATTIGDVRAFLADQGIDLDPYVDHTGGRPTFNPGKLERQKEFQKLLEEALPRWEADLTKYATPRREHTPAA
jgi:hypothetical protein